MLQDMKRRRFLQTIAAAPAAPAVLAAQQTARPAAPAAPKALATAHPDEVAEPTPRFFTHVQFDALKKLSDVLVPASDGNPGALDAEVPQFIDFLIGQSPADRQHLYRSGLDLLNARSMKQFNKAFGALDVKDADSILRPLMVPVPWTYDPPKDLGSHFATTAHDDIRTATRNSREWASHLRKRAGASQGPSFTGTRSIRFIKVKLWRNKISMF